MGGKLDDGGGSGSFGVSASDFVSGTNVEWVKLARTLVGGTIGAVFAGWISVVLGVADLVIRPIAWLSGWLGRLVAVTAGTPADLVARSWRGATEFVLEGGPFAFAFAVAVVVLTLYVGVRVVRLA